MWGEIHTVIIFTGLTGKEIIMEKILHKTDDRFIEKCIEATDTLISEIKNSKTDITYTGKAYYVSEFGDDSNDGASPERAWKSIARVNQADLRQGDAVLFKRGERFRSEESVFIKNGVTYSTYGEGKKPLLIFSLDASGEGSWLPTDREGVFVYNRRFTGFEYDASMIVINGGALWGIKVSGTKSGNRLNNGRVFNGREWIGDCNDPLPDYHGLKNDLEFYHDWNDGGIYLCSKQGNPGKLFDSIEITRRMHGFSGRIVKDVAIDNLSVYGVGAHGIGCGESVENLSVSYCTFEWIGGAIQEPFIFGRDYHTRFGNAVEAASRYCDGFTIHHCYSSQVYDCCYTVQYGPAEFKNIHYYKNVAEFCNTGLEVWQSGTLIENMRLHDNINRYCGYGFSHQRPGKDGNFFYDAENTTSVYKNNDVCNNLNYFASVFSHLVCATGPKQYNFHDNIYIMEEGKMLGGVAENPGEGSGHFTDVPYDEAHVKAAVDTGFERGSKFYLTENFGDDMYRLYGKLKGFAQKLEV